MLYYISHPSEVMPHLNFFQTMRLQNHVISKIHAYLLKSYLMCIIYLFLLSSFMHVSHQKSQMVKIYPKLDDYEKCWPVLDMVCTFLVNHHADQAKKVRDRTKHGRSQFQDANNLILFTCHRCGCWSYAI
jgi:hypothetical protein